jgi:ABC-type transporter MlaC component
MDEQELRARSADLAIKYLSIPVLASSMATLGEEGLEMVSVEQIAKITAVFRRYLESGEYPLQQ